MMSKSIHGRTSERFIQSLNLSNAMMMQLMSIESFQRTTNDIKTSTQ